MCSWAEPISLLNGKEISGGSSIKQETPASSHMERFSSRALRFPPLESTAASDTRGCWKLIEMEG